MKPVGLLAVVLLVAGPVRAQEWVIEDDGVNPFTGTHEARATLVSSPDLVTWTETLATPELLVQCLYGRLRLRVVWHTNRNFGEELQWLVGTTERPVRTREWIGGFGYQYHEDAPRNGWLERVVEEGEVLYLSASGSDLRMYAAFELPENTADVVAEIRRICRRGN